MQAYTKIPCVNTENIRGTQNNFSQSKGCCKWETLVDTENSLCTQGNLWIGTTLFCFVKVMWSTQSFLCVDTGLSM